jgi:hypothetical protein
LAYLVRCWPVETEEGFVWRAAIEGAYDAERRRFADLNALFAFLKERTEACSTELTQERE